ncbi:MAG: hypothetical protein HYW26_04695 [Candidatus Aenigmarchaeota archaeon]|nr:hypothetical protein [Candidatus Aenigmarchaeota archaeon]
MRRISDEEAHEIRKKELKFTRHFYEREAHRINFQKIKEIWEHGEIFQEGKNKFRVSLPI